MDFINEDSPNRKSFVKSQLARLKPTPKPETKPLPKSEEAFAGDFLLIEGSWPVSRSLAKKLGYSVGDPDEG
jgi:hypothetical protein